MTWLFVRVKLFFVLVCSFFSLILVLCSSCQISVGLSVVIEIDLNSGLEYEWYSFGQHVGASKLRIILRVFFLVLHVVCNYIVYTRRNTTYT